MQVAFLSKHRFTTDEPLGPDLDNLMKMDALKQTIFDPQRGSDDSPVVALEVSNA